MAVKMDWITILMAFSFVPALASNPGEPGLVDIKFPSHKLPAALTQAYVSPTLLSGSTLFLMALLFMHIAKLMSVTMPSPPGEWPIMFCGPPFNHQLKNIYYYLRSFIPNFTVLFRNLENI